MQKGGAKKPVFKKQHQRHPGLEYKMDPLPAAYDSLPGSDKLLNKKCIITGGDSGIGRAVAIAFAREGADVAIIYLKEEEADAQHTASVIKDLYQHDCLLIPTDIGRESNCKKAIRKIVKVHKQIDVLVNNAAVHYPEEDFMKITSKHLTETFAVNILAMFWITQAVLPYMKEGSSIINTSSVTAYRGSGGLVDYSSTKGAIVSFTRSLSANLIKKGIRVNGVAPGPVWTPLVAASFPADKIQTYGTDAPMNRAAQPVEVAPAYVFLASEDASYISGQFIHVNGGEIING